jgi:hypothetical protein
MKSDDQSIEVSYEVAEKFLLLKKVADHPGVRIKSGPLEN